MLMIITLITNKTKARELATFLANCLGSEARQLTYLFKPFQVNVAKKHLQILFLTLNVYLGINFTGKEPSLNFRGLLSLIPFSSFNLQNAASDCSEPLARGNPINAQRCFWNSNSSLTCFFYSMTLFGTKYLKYILIKRKINSFGESWPKIYVTSLSNDTQSYLEGPIFFVRSCLFLQFLLNFEAKHCLIKSWFFFKGL